VIDYRFYTALAEIMDAAHSNEIVYEVKKLAGSVPLVKDVQKCYVRKMGFDYYVEKRHSFIEIGRSNRQAKRY
jgi:divalent metal cation (Fe/Co/Zn/Cd) transporter